MKSQGYKIYKGIQGNRYKLWTIVEDGKISYQLEHVWGPGRTWGVIAEGDAEDVKPVMERLMLERVKRG